MATAAAVVDGVVVAAAAVEVVVGEAAVVVVAMGEVVSAQICCQRAPRAQLNDRAVGSSQAVATALLLNNKATATGHLKATNSLLWAMVSSPCTPSSPWVATVATAATLSSPCMCSKVAEAVEAWVPGVPPHWVLAVVCSAA